MTQIKGGQDVIEKNVFAHDEINLNALMKKE